jgi:hypothetical protein
MIYEKLSDSTEAFIAYSGDQQPPASEFGFQPSAYGQQGMLINLAGPEFERQDRFHFEDGESRDEALRPRLGDDPVHEVASGLVPVHFC